MQFHIRSKKDLEILLQKLSKSKSYKYGLEQYPTDASLAAEILTLAYLDGNIENKVIGDFGAGNGIFSIGAMALGASKVYAVELDPDQCRIIRENAGNLDIEVLNISMEQFDRQVDTVVMNPPFGSVREGADRVFLEKAVSLAKHIYSLHNYKSRDFIRKFYTENARIMREKEVKIKVPRLYPHHEKDYEEISAVLFTCESNPG